MNRRELFVGAACGVATGLTGCLSEFGVGSLESRTDARSYDPPSGTELTVRNRNGPVTVEGSDGDAVEVDITYEGPSASALDAVTVTGTESDDALSIETEYGDDDADRVRVALSIQCPERVSVGRLVTGNGAIEVTDVAGDPTLETSNGEIDARNVDGAVAMSASRGSLTARTIGELAGARTSNGSIDVDVPAVTDDASIETANGSIDAALAGSLDVTLTASTANGSVTVEELDLADGERTEGRVSGSLGDGTHSLSVETANGSIDLRQLPASGTG